MSKKYYRGWLYANIDDYDALRALGVFGPMIYIPSDRNSVNKALEKKQVLKEAIANEMRKFEEETGMKIDEISHVRYGCNGN